jgi:hypothetical protein
MIVKHALTISRTCPVDDAHDIYDVFVETARTVKVEDILAAAAALPDRIYQEELTTILAAKLNCTVTTIGFHKGVKTICRV